MNEVKIMVEEGVDDIILRYQKKFGIEDGGVDPLMALELDEIEGQLISWIERAFPRLAS